MKKIWENIVGDIIIHRENKSELNKIVSDLQGKYEITYKPQYSVNLRKEILALTSRMKRKAKSSKSDIYYDLQILEMEIRPYPTEDGKWCIYRKLDAIQTGIGKMLFSEADYFKLYSLVELYIRKTI